MKSLGYTKVVAQGGDSGALIDRLPVGGHFAAWEQPALLSAELRTAFKPFQSN